MLLNMNIRRSIQSISQLIYIPMRTCCGEGIKYYGFTYYPRNKDFKDPPYEPTKLFLIKRIKHYGISHAEKKILGYLNIDGRRNLNGHISVVKNIPSTNALLWKVKHIVEIKPITWNGELPKDFLGTHLRETGELVISPLVKVTEEQIQCTEKALNSGKKHSNTYLKEYLHKKWWNGYSGIV